MEIKKLTNKAEITAENIKKTLVNGFESFNKDDLINILNSLPVAVMLLDKKGKFIIINSKFTEITGYHYSEIPDIEAWFNKAYPDSEYRKKIFTKWKGVKNFLPGETNRDITITCRDGSVKDVIFSSARLNDGSSFVTMVDITQLKEAEAKLQKSEEQFKIMFEAAHDPIYVLSKDGRFLQWNRATEEMTGRSDLADEYFYNFLMPEYKKELLEFYLHQYKNNIELTYKEFPVMIQGKKVWIGQNTVPYKKDEAGNTISFLIISRNITEQMKLQQELEKKNRELEELSSSDPLTGLYNRRYFNDFFPQIIKNASRFNKSLAVIFIDLNDFKKANDTYGHAFGDEILKSFAHVLKNSGMRETDIICRYGGDEFVLVLGGLDYIHSRGIVERIIKDIAKSWDRKKDESPVIKDAVELNLGLSIGVRLVNYRDINQFLNNNGLSEKIDDEILKQADASMYVAKEKYKKSQNKKESQFHFFNGNL